MINDYTMITVTFMDNTFVMDSTMLNRFIADPDKYAHAFAYELQTRIAAAIYMKENPMPPSRFAKYIQQSTLGATGEILMPEEYYQEFKTREEATDFLFRSLKEGETK